MSDKYIRIHLDSDEADKKAKDLDKNINKLDDSADKASFSMNKLAAAVSAVVASGALVAFFRNSIQTAARFNGAMARVGAITRATDEQLQALTATAREMGATTEFSAEQAAAGLQFLGMAGFETEESIAALPGLLDLATVAALDLGSAADIASNIMSGFNIEATETSDVVDLLAATSTRANTNVEQLGRAMSFVAPIASGFGIDIEEVSAAIGKLSDAGIQGERAGTGLRTVLSGLASQSGPAQKALAQLGVTAEQVNPAANSLTDIIDTLGEAGLTAADAFEIFGAEGAPAILALVNQRSGLRELATTLGDVEGEASEMAATFRDTLTGDVKTLESAYQDLQITLGNMFTDEARASVQSLTEATRFVAENLDEILNVVELLAVALGTRLAVAVGASAVAFTQQTAASLRATTTMNALGQVTKRTTVATNALTVASRAARGALALLGGPVGIVALAATTFLTYSSNVDEATTKTKEAINATDILTKSIDGLSQAQAKIARREAEEALEAQIQKVEELGEKAQDFQQLADALGRDAFLTGDTVTVGERLTEANEDLELAQENLGKILTRYKEIDNIAKGMGGLPTPESPVSGGAEDPIGDDTENRTVRQLEATTASMQRELEKRRALQQLHGSLMLAQDQMIWDQQKAENEVRRQEELINEEARFTEEKARRDARFTELLEDDKLKREERIAIETQWDSQSEIAKQIHEQNKTQIEQDAANARVQIAKAEWQAKLQMTQQVGQDIMSIFAGQSRTAFEIGKGAAIASATVKGYDAAVAAWDAGMSTGGPWAPAVAAAYMSASILKTGAQINAIKSTKFGSGSGGNASAGGSGLPNVSTPPSSTQTTTPELQVPQEQQVDAIDFGPVVDELRNQDGVVSTEFVARILESAQEATRLTGRTSM